MKRQRNLRALRVILPFLLILTLVNAAPAAQNDPSAWSWQRGGLHKMHWAQPPDEGFTGVGVSVSQGPLAGDFRCTSTGPVLSVHLWGVFLGDVLPKKGPGGLKLELSIHADVPGPEGVGSRPGEALWSRAFNPGQYTTAKVHDGPEDWYDPVTGDYLRADARNTYQYDFRVETEPFIAQTGRIYWLTVRDLSASAGYTFGWKSTARQFRWNGDRAGLRSEEAGWVRMTYPQGHTYAGETLDLAFVVAGGDESLPLYDCGDAPDGSNNVAGAAMTAYPDGTAAHFPTAYYAGSPPFGPMHRYPRDKFYLGRWVSLEREGDIGVDEDSVNNLDPQNDAANRDGGDDGLQLPAVMPSCRETTLKYAVTVTSPGAKQAYVNVWCDWNRDGDWDDTVTCADVNEVPERAVQNQQPSLPGPGTYTLTTPAFRCWHPAKDTIGPMWLRITISDQPWQPADANTPGGAGPEGGYACGETEDYYIQPLAEAAPVQYDWGDAPDEAAKAGYPTLAAHNGARHVIAGPWFGDQSGRPDAEANGRPNAKALGDDTGGSNDEQGALIPPLVQGRPAAATVEVSGGGGVVQAWIDFDGDKRWQDDEKICDRFLPDGIHAIPFTVPYDATVARTFARFRISRDGGLAPSGDAPDGEVEDHQVSIDSQFDVKGWGQWPDTTPDGMSVRVDNSDGKRRIVADDFECTMPGRLTHVRLWGSWKDDRRGAIARIRLRVHADDPVGSNGPDATNRYAKPSSAILWEREYVSEELEETSYHVAAIGGLWWRDPISGAAAPSRGTHIWRIDINVDPSSSFAQDGLPASPRNYWLAVEMETVNGQFGWCARQWPEHTAADATWSTGTKPPVAWGESFYPLGHAHYDVERNSVDMAFCLLFQADNPKATTEPLAITQCPAIETLCPASATRCPLTTTQCPPMATLCPSVPTQCWGMPTQCPVQQTMCPLGQTWCPVIETVCPASETQCPEWHTQCPMTPTNCPLSVTQCEAIQTMCPAVQTVCPQTVTQCQLVQSMCPSVQTLCPPVETTCPPAATECPRISTNCLSAQAQSATPVVASLMEPQATACPLVETDCPTVGRVAVLLKGSK